MIKMTFQGVINTWLKRDYKIQAGVDPPPTHPFGSSLTHSSMSILVYSWHQSGRLETAAKYFETNDATINIVTISGCFKCSSSMPLNFLLGGVTFELDVWLVLQIIDVHRL